MQRKPRASGGSYIVTDNIDNGAPHAVDKCILDAFKACEIGWEEMQVLTFDVVPPAKYEDKYALECLIDSYLRVDKIMTAFLVGHGLPCAKFNTLE